MDLGSDITKIKGIGEKTAILFAKLGVVTVNDLLHFFPRNYIHFPYRKPIRELINQEFCVIEGYITGNARSFRKNGRDILSFDVSDGEERITFHYFGMPYLRKQMIPGKRILAQGICKVKNGKKSLAQPKILKNEEYDEMKGTLQPIYPLTEGLTNHKVRQSIQAILDSCDLIQEYLPEYIVIRENMLNIGKAIRQMHFPENMDMVNAARQRLAFDEFFLFQLKIHELKLGNIKKKSLYVMKDLGGCDSFIGKLTFELTKGQKECVLQVKEDLCSGYQMNRLVQGDVGCGKTIVAFLASLLVIENGYQAAMMAPTEVLARQHFLDLCRMSEEYELPIQPVLLTGSMPAREKRENRKKIENGCANMVIGTHALLQDTVEFANLGLVITDEQHRFGVKQRSTLMGKGQEVHVLVMSATPIPRTLGLVLYGDMDVSVIAELPSNRLPIKNAVVDTSYREKLYTFILKRIAEGRQAYIVCPMVEEGEMDTLTNVTDYVEEMQQRFGTYAKVAMLHGKMKPAIKDEVMQSFKNHEIDLLVSTTVVEVGVNVPNATVMMVENAERFGLSQLHQLRGRVGRGSEQSYCMFVIGSDSQKAKERLKIMAETNDGFKIAEEDLKQRGPGDFFGLRQSGLPQFAIADIFTDAAILQKTKIILEEIRENVPEYFILLREQYKQKEEMSFIDFHTICL